jgi:hypothetical protein
MPSIARYYSSTAAKTTLSSAIDASTTSTSLSLAAASGLPSQYPFTLILEKDTANEEIVTVTALVGTAYTVTRGVDGTTSKAHSVGATVEHGVSALDFSDFRTHEAATNAHGVTGDIVGTGGAQTLTGKTLTTATLGSILDAGGYKITNLATPTSSSDAVRKDFADAQVTAAASSATAAASSATAAASSATAAATSATSASNSASAASTSATSALTSQTAAATSAASALTSQTAAATSAASALASQTAAATSAASALTSQTAAATSAASALTSQTSAATSATSAANSATTAAASVATIAGYATDAANSAAAAATSATSAANSATAAATSASSANTSASSAVTTYNSIIGLTGSGILRDLGSITDTDTTTTTYLNVATLTASAAASATAAATSASSASTSASSAATSYDNFDDRYLGSKASAPTLDNDGDALLEGALYWNSTNKNMNVYNGTAWEVVTTSGDITAVTAGTGLSGGGGSGAVTVSLDTSSVYVLPAQATHTGKYLTTNGSTASWGTVDALPSQSGNGGKYLTTNGSTASWASIVTDPLTDIFMMMGA